MHRTYSTSSGARVLPVGRSKGTTVPTSQVGLVCHHEGRLSGQLHVVQPQLLLQAGQVLHRVPPLRTRGVDNEHQGPSPRHVPQELVTEPAISVGAVDQARDVGHAQADSVLRFGARARRGPLGGGHAKHQQLTAGSIIPGILCI